VAPLRRNRWPPSRGISGRVRLEYAAYDEFARRPEITGYACWAHARRHLYEAKDSAPEEAEYALTEIQKLYAIERTLREAGASPVERSRVRQAEAAPILASFKTWLEANPGLPKSPWGKAVYYALVRWKKLTAYTEDGRIEIDNNLVENAIRPIALGRRNYLFMGSHEAAQRGAMIYSLLGTCKKQGIEPFEWLRDVLTRIPGLPARAVSELLPHRWTLGG
jgi:transposase